MISAVVVIWPSYLLFYFCLFVFVFLLLSCKSYLFLSNCLSPLSSSSDLCIYVPCKFILYKISHLNLMRTRPTCWLVSSNALSFIQPISNIIRDTEILARHELKHVLKYVLIGYSIIHIMPFTQSQVSLGRQSDLACL